MKRESILVLIGAVFIILFLYTGFEKLIDHRAFLSTIRKSTLLKPIAVPVSYSIPMLEVLTAILLLASRTQRIGLYVACLLMAAFSAYVGFMLASKSDLPCSCGGIVRYLNWHQHLYFNISLTLLALTGILIGSRGGNPVQLPRGKIKYGLTRKVI